MEYLGQSNKGTASIKVVEYRNKYKFIISIFYKSDEGHILSDLIKDQQFKRYFNKIPGKDYYIPTSELTVNIINKGTNIYFDILFDANNAYWFITGETTTNKSFNQLKNYILSGEELAIQLQSPSYNFMIPGIQNSSSLLIDIDSNKSRVLKHTITIKE